MNSHPNRRKEITIYSICILLSIGIFLFQSITLAHRLPSQMDEGAFLTKGYLFVTGRYTPFEDYGPWTNNMPLAYIIPGIPQALFGPSLVVGRYFAILTALLTLLGIWITVNRLCGKWWALFAIAVLALNNAWIAMNVQVFSQVTVACLVSWMLVFLLGRNRTAFQIALAGIFAAMSVLTRQNMVFLLPFVVLYIFWQHGFKMALISFIFAALPLIGVHVYFYPKIMNLWTPWLPVFIKDIFVSNNPLNILGEQVWKPTPSMLDRVSSFFITIKYYFVPFLASAISIPLLIKKSKWKDVKDWKIGISLLILFLTFFGMHAWASLGKNYCVFCFSNYISFFIPVGIILLALTLKELFNEDNKLSLPYIVIPMGILVPGIMFGSKDTVGRMILQLPVPRIRNGRFIGGNTMVWELLRNRFGFDYDYLLNILPPIIGLIIAFVLTIVLILLINKYRVKNAQHHAGNVFAVLILLAGFILTPSNLLSKFPVSNTCNGDALQAYEEAGKQLRSSIPKTANVYWGSGSQVTPLLYLADYNIQPLQLNGIYNKILEGDRNELEKLGYYSAESENNWRESAGYILVQIRHMGDYLKSYLDPLLYDELNPTVPINPCDPNTSIKIFRKK